MSMWTPEAIRALGPTTDLPTLGSIVGCSRWKAYQMARTGEWETVGIKIVRLGSKYRVVVASIIAVLGYGDPPAAVREPASAAWFQSQPKADGVPARFQPDSTALQTGTSRG